MLPQTDRATSCVIRNLVTPAQLSEQFVQQTDRTDMYNKLYVQLSNQFKLNQIYLLKTHHI